MSIATQIQRLNVAKSNVKEVVNQDFGFIQNETVSDYATKINETIEEYKKYIPEATVEGTELNVDDAVPIRSKIEPKGNTKQKQLSGNQLIDFNNVVAYKQTSSTSFNSDVFTLEDTGSNYTLASIDITSLYKAHPGSILKFVYDSININSQFGTIVQLRIIYNDSTPIAYSLLLKHNLDSFSHTIPNDISNIESVLFEIYSNNTNTSRASSVSISKPMLQFGNEAKEYEEYCGGQASPNPDYPQEIEVVTGENVIKHVGKNLWRFLASNWISDNSVSHNIIDENTLEVTSTNNTYANSKFRLDLPDGTYTFKLGKVTNSNANMSTKRMTLTKYENGTRNAMQHIDEGNSCTYTISNNENEYYVLEFWASYTTALINTARFENVQIEQGSTATTYEPYREEEYELSLGNIELCKIGNYSDILFKNVVGDENYNAELESGAWYKKKTINKKVLDGSENWIYDDLYNGIYQYSIIASDALYSTNTVLTILCSRFLGVEFLSSWLLDNAITIVNDTTNGNRIRIMTSDNTTIASLINTLRDNNAVVYYVLKTPTYEQITDSTLISQLEALRKAKWYKEVNHWWTETENLEPVLKGTYKQIVSESEGE